MWQTNRRTQPFKVKDNLFIKLFRHYDKCGALCWPVLSDAGSLGSLSLAGGWALLSVPVIIWPLPRGRWGITLPQPRRDTTTRMRGWRSASTSQTGDIEIPAAWLVPAGLQGDLSSIVNLEEYSKVQSSTFNVACPMSRLTPLVWQCCDTHFAPS